ncbi:MAG TPA: hypothetical protein VL551_34375 [Actinospica sp.]|jgi:hypothetical protein|nr:hypothetical protein [Actinospica sp.]
MTRTPRADHVGAIGPVTAGRVSASHITRPGACRGGPEPGPAGDSPGHNDLRTIVLGLSWPKPTSTERARSAIEALRRTHAQLSAITDTVPDPGLRAAVAALAGTAGFVLDYWPTALETIAPQAWNTEHEAALTADLAQIALAGVPVLDLLETSARPARPGQPGEDPSGELRLVAARHRRGSREPAQPARAVVPRSQWSAFVAGLAADPHRRRAVVVWGAGLVMLALAAGWYLKYDMHHPGSAAPRPTGVRTNAAASAAVDRPTGPSSSSPVVSASASASQASSATVTSVQLELLGSSAQVPQIVVELLIDTATSGAFQLQATWGRPGAAPTGRETRVLSGATSYYFTLPIPAAALCGGPVAVQAQAGTVTASTTTLAGSCPPSASPSSLARNQ